MRSRDEIKKSIEDAIRKQFPRDTVDVSDGYRDNIHVVVVSRRFDEMGEQEQRDLLWGLIDEADLDDEEKKLISLVMPVSPSLLK
jgi:hypothetical protein